MERKRRWKSLVTAGVMANILALAQPFNSAAADWDTGKAVQIGRKGIEFNDYVYYGDYKGNPVKWRVLDADSTNTGNPGIFLLSEYLLDKIKYAALNESGDIRNGTEIWENSDALIWCRNFEQSAFEPGEQASVLSTTDGYLLKDDRLFFLAHGEAGANSYGFLTEDSRIAYYEEGGAAASWWTRTSPTGFSGHSTGLVGGSGSFGSFVTWMESGARPAFNLDQDDICLISDCPALEPGDTSDPAILQKVPVYWGTLNRGEWKLTLKDDSRNGFQVSADNVEPALKGYTDWKVDVSYSGARAGDREYVYALLCNDEDVVLYYNDIARHNESGTQTVWIPKGLDPGNYTLKLFSAQWNGYMQTGYASEFVDIPLEVQSTQIPKMTKPEGVFEALDDRQGELVNVSAGMRYSVDGGNVWKDVIGETMEIVDVTEDLDIRVYQPGDGFHALDSDIQTIDVTQAKKPEGLEGIACKTQAQNDGKITGVNDTMEYIPAMSARAARDGGKSGASGWIPVNGSQVEGLSAGTYYVRVKARGPVLASPVEAVTVAEYREEHVCAGTGEWHSDGARHWKLCTCGARVDEGLHIGGIASCTEKAECDICKEAYGELGAHRLGEWIEESPADCISEGTLGHYHCGLCDTDFDGEKNRLNSVAIPVDPASHTGGTQIRGQKEAMCTEEGYTGDTYCTGCKQELTKGTVIPARGSHVFGEWKVTVEATVSQTGMKERVCTVCGYVESTVIPMISEEDKPEQSGKEETVIKKPEPSKQKEPAVRKPGSPKTADMAGTNRWAALLFLAGVTYAGMFSRRKRTEK